MPYAPARHAAAAAADDDDVNDNDDDDGMASICPVRSSDRPIARSDSALESQFSLNAFAHCPFSFSIFN